MALRLLDQADRALPYNRDLSRRLDVELATVILIRDREYVCEDRAAERVREAPPPAPAEPGSLADEVRAMGLM